LNLPAPDIALLLFTRSASEEVRHKRLLPNGEFNQHYGLANKFVQNNEEVLAASGLPYIVFSSEFQKGDSFGERLHHAFSCLFSLGYNRVIAIGNDCPELKTQHILKAATCLNNQEVVLGPDKAGGIYLLGLTQSVFKKCSSFSFIRWNTEAVLTDAEAYFHQLAPTQVLPDKLQDLNSSQDFTVAIKNKIFKPSFLKFIKRLLRINSTCLPDLQVPILGFVLLRPLLFRGPPVIALFSIFLLIRISRIN
jgi:uncharacterized protein